VNDKLKVKKAVRSPTDKEDSDCDSHSNGHTYSNGYAKSYSYTTAAPRFAASSYPTVTGAR
jgi:hypothetical protein